MLAVFTRNVSVWWKGDLHQPQSSPILVYGYFDRCFSSNRKYLQPTRCFYNSTTTIISSARASSSWVLLIGLSDGLKLKDWTVVTAGKCLPNEKWTGYLSALGGRTQTLDSVELPKERQQQQRLHIRLVQTWEEHNLENYYGLFESNKYYIS